MTFNSSSSGLVGSSRWHVADAQFLVAHRRTAWNLGEVAQKPVNNWGKTNDAKAVKTVCCIFGAKR